MSTDNGTAASGPYVITVTTPYRSDAGDAPSHAFEPTVTRRAVATLEEKRAAIGELTRNAPGISIHAADDGGTIGPLPDGTVIEVAPTLSWGGAPIGMARWLREDQGWSIPAGMDDDEAIAAFNAAQTEAMAA